METAFTRQNNKKALTYLKACYYCQRRYYRLIYAVIAISVTVCFLGIFNKYLDNTLSVFKITGEGVTKAKTAIASYLNFVSAVVLIANIFISRVIDRLIKESVNIMEKYDCYVFNIPLNQSIMRPVSDAQIDQYAGRVKKPNKLFYNYYFENEEEAESKTAVFENQKRSIYTEYRLMLSVQAFFITLWVSFIVLVFLIGVSFNDDFIGTLINVLFPALSILSLIAGSWYSFNEQMRRLQIMADVANRLTDADNKQRIENMTSVINQRSVQDAIFFQRLNAFTIPQFLIRSFEKIIMQNKTMTAAQIKRAPSSEINSIDVDSAARTAKSRGSYPSKVKRKVQAQNMTLDAGLLKDTETANSEIAASSVKKPAKSKPKTTKITPQKKDNLVNRLTSKSQPAAKDSGEKTKKSTDKK